MTCEPRFYIDHGVIHDRVTGKHVVTDGQPPFEDSLEQVLGLLNELCGMGNGEALVGAALARWCYENPNLAARTIEGLRSPSDSSHIRGGT